MRAAGVRFKVQQRWFPRDPDSPEAYEDASAVSRRLGRAVIADGVSSAMMSRSWARLLTRNAVVSPPKFDDESLATWVTGLQDVWWKQVDPSRLSWSGQEKLRRSGAQSTLLIADVEPLNAADTRHDDWSSQSEYRLTAHAIGDSCLFLVRDGRKILAFPLAKAVEFEASPFALSSKTKGIKYADQFRHLDDRCRVGDVLVLCTDAIAAWAMREYEAGRPVDWQRYRDDEAAWQADILEFRGIGPADDRNRLIVDDCTLLVLDIVSEMVDEEVPDIDPDRSDESFVLHGVSEVAAGDGVAEGTSPGLPGGLADEQVSPEPLNQSIDLGVVSIRGPDDDHGQVDATAKTCDSQLPRETTDEPGNPADEKPAAESDDFARTRRIL